MQQHSLSCPTHGRRWTGAAWLGLAIALCAGCGLEDYQKQMAAEQKWVEKFDRIVGAENQMLGDPLDMPPKILKDKKDEKGKTVTTKVNPLPDLFLRPPTGISSKAGNPLGGASATLYPYSGRGTALRLLVAGTSDKEKKPHGFRVDVCRSAGITNQKFETVKKETLGPEPREFYRTSQDIGAKHYAVYFFAQDNDQLAVIFEMPKDQAKEMDKLIDVCLGTLELGYHAFEISSAYEQQNNRGKYYRLRMASK